MTFEAGSDKISFYENLAKDENLTSDTLKFILNTKCWGGFKEDEFSSDVNLSNSINDCYNFKEPNKDETRHSGSTILIIDADGDGDKDLLLGDLTNENIKFLKTAETLKSVAERSRSYLPFYRCCSQNASVSCCFFS